MSIELNLSTEEFKDAPFLDKFEIQMETKKRKVQNYRERYYFFVNDGMFSICDRIKVSKLNSLLTLTFHFIHDHLSILLSYVDIS